MPWPPRAANWSPPGPAGLAKKPVFLALRIARLVDQRREEGEEVHAHRRQVLGDRLVVLGENGVGPARRREGVEFLVGIERGNGLVGVDEAVDLVGRIVAELAAVARRAGFEARCQRRHGNCRCRWRRRSSSGPADRRTRRCRAAAFKFFGTREVVAVLGLEGFHLLRVLEPVLAIGPADGVAFERDRPVLAAVAWIFGIEFHRGRSHELRRRRAC